jgi:ParB family chromosome partitioning protein
MPKSTPRLGRGLSAIIGPRTVSHFPPRVAAASDAPPLPTDIRHVAIDAIVPNPRQPRLPFDDAGLKELAASIRANGIIQPVLLRSAQAGRYELVAGERRWRAAKLAGLDSIPAVVRELSDAQSLELALVENLQREELGPLERAGGYQEYLHTFGASVEQLADRLGESRANVANYLRLLRLPTEIQQLITAGHLEMGQARALLGIDDPQRQLAIARLAGRRNLSVRQVERLARGSQTGAAEPRSPGPRARAKHLGDIERALTRALGLPVALQPGKKKNSGRVVIRYKNLDEFDRIAERLGGSSSLEDG